MNSVSPEAFARRLVALYGGREVALKVLEKRHQSILNVWNRDALIIGRILRSHLFVEHFLTEYLQFYNPKIGDLEKARISFAQKISLISEADKLVSYLIPGLQRLNRVRNRIAHTLQSEITTDDRDLFLSIEMFRAMRNALAEPEPPSLEPLVVLEDFAKHAGLALAPNPDQDKWIKAMAVDQVEIGNQE